MHNWGEGHGGLRLRSYKNHKVCIASRRRESLIKVSKIFMSKSLGARCVLNDVARSHHLLQGEDSLLFNWRSPSALDRRRTDKKHTATTVPFECQSQTSRQHIATTVPSLSAPALHLRHVMRLKAISTLPWIFKQICRRSGLLRHLDAVIGPPPIVQKSSSLLENSIS
jgi:hypothetical protein